MNNILVNCMLISGQNYQMIICSQASLLRYFRTQYAQFVESSQTSLKMISLYYSTYFN